MIWRWLRESVSDVRQARRASRLRRDAQRLCDEQRYTDAIPLLQTALGLVVPRNDRTSYGVQVSVTLDVSMLLAVAAARAGERAVAATSISGALALMDELRGLDPNFPFSEDVRRWEEWARAYAG